MMDFGFFSLIPPLFAILLAIVTRRVVIPLAVGVAFGAVILSLGRVELRTDLNTDGEVLVRILAPSPWVSGERFFLLMQSMNRGPRPLSVVHLELSPGGRKAEGGYLVSLNIGCLGWNIFLMNITLFTPTWCCKFVAEITTSFALFLFSSKVKT